jgi:1,4-dihydroxy-2-naphthoyl-CoA synthase
VLRGMAAGTQKEAFAIESELAGKIFSSDDAKEGPKAFAEKREPNWTGT